MINCDDHSQTVCCLGERLWSPVSWVGVLALPFNSCATVRQVNSTKIVVQSLLCTHKPWAGNTKDSEVDHKKPRSLLALSSSSVKCEQAAPRCLDVPGTCRAGSHCTPPGLQEVGSPTSSSATQEAGTQGVRQLGRACSRVRQCLSSLHLHQPPLLPPSPTWQMSPQSEWDNRRECSAADQEPHRCMTSWLLIMETAQLIHDPSRWTT